jgi:thioredoxin-like negative regulator of GroEL
MSFVNRCHDRWANLHPAWRFLGVAAGMAVVTFGVMRPGLDLYRDFRDHQRLKGAAEALDAGRYAEARDLTRAVLQRDGTRKDAYPILLRASEALNDSRRAQVALALLADTNASQADRTEAWRICCKSTASWIVRSVWLELPETERSNQTFIGHLTDRLVYDGHLAEAEKLISDLESPLATELEERRMRILAMKGTRAAYQEFQLRLGGLLPRIDGDSRVPQLLDEVPQSDLLPGLQTPLREWQERTGQQSPEQVLRLARCQMADDPDQADHFFSEFHERYRESAPLETAHWCLQLGLTEEADAILTVLPTGPDEDPQRFLLHYEVLEKLAAHERWIALLESAPPTIPAAWVACERAALGELLGDAKSMNLAMDLALREASEDPDDDALITLARHAKRRGLSLLARNAWLEAIRRKSGPLPLLSSIQGEVESLANDQKENELFEVLNTYRLIERSNPAVIAQHDYLACLNGRLAPENLIENLSPIHAQHPEALPVSCILALGHLLVDQPERAKELTDKDIDWLSAVPAYRAVRGLALQATGQNDQAAALLTDFPWTKLLPSERKTFQAMAEARRGR